MPTSTTTTPPNAAERGFELKKSRRWPLLAAAAAVAVAVVAAVVLTSTGGSPAGAAHFGSQLKVAYLANDAAQQTVLEYVAKEIAPDYGVSVIPTAIGDPNQLSQATNDGDIAATVYAHRPWIEQTNAAKGWRITPTEPVFQWAYSLYSARYPSLEELPDGATVAILDDPANTAQALMLLAGADVITLDPAVEPAKATLKDVTENPRNLVLKPIAFGTAARSLSDLDAIISYNFEFVAAGTPARYKIYAPDAPPIFAAQLSIGTRYLTDPSIEKLVDAFADPRLQEYLATTDDPKVHDQLTPVSRP
jgi:ABC-type metal ion transport system, periplasmic component/surface antigen